MFLILVTISLFLAILGLILLAIDEFYVEIFKNVAQMTTFYTILSSFIVIIATFLFILL